MRLHRLEITGIGPYAGTEEIDFDGLNEAGVHLLTGPTGAGKSTVLDAISFAIYGRVPRHGSSKPDLASDHLSEGTEPRVILEVTIGSSRLKITRSPEYQRPKIHGDGMTPEGQKVAVEELENGEWIALSGAWTEANRDLERRVGMSPEQFGQVVMLPQGEFATFLKADARERRSLLEHLFPTQDFTQVETWFKKRADEDRRKRDEKLREIENRIEAVKPVVNNAREDGVEDLEVGPDPGEGGPLLEWIEATGKILSGVAAAAKAQQEAAVKESEARDKELNLLKKQAELVVLRGQAEDRLKRLSRNDARRKEVGKEIERAESAALVTPLADAATGSAATLEESRNRHGKLRELLLERDEVETGEPDELEQVSKENSKLLAKLSAFENDSLPRRRLLGTEVAELAREKDGLEATGPKTELGIAEAELAEATEGRKNARQEYIDARHHRTQGMAAELAGELKPGKPCAVCGSTEHPTPAVAAGTMVSQEEEDAAAEADAAAETRENSAKQGCQAIRDRLKQRLAEIGSETKAAATELKKLEEQESKLTGNAASLGERRELVQGLVDQIDEFQKLETKLVSDEAAAGQARKAAGKAAKENGFKTVEAAIGATVTREALTALKKEARDHDDALAAVNERLGGELKDIKRDEVVEVAGAEAAAGAAKQTRDEKTASWSTANERSATFATETGPVADLHAEVEPLREIARRSDHLKRLVNGENERKMPLSIFVLAARLRQVIDAANVRLRKMSGGRYELLYSGDKKGNAISGLGIEVMDGNTSHSRPTGTLSGGESFYASLSLALGLAEVVQQESGGRRLDTLFIDEGFGTLDSETLDQVMNEIDSLREGGRTVGLVSHVEELRTRIPAQIQIEKDHTGSTIRTVGL